MPNIIQPMSPTAENANSLGDLIKMGLAKQGLSQRALADQIGLSQQTVSAWIGGRFSPSVEQQSSLALILDIPLEEFQSFKKSSSGPMKFSVTPEGVLWRVAMDNAVDLECMTAMVKAYDEFQKRVKNG